ncbi:MAG TPA: NAD(P)-dependent oxidoreductase [Chloroflexota bacterium]
MLVLVTGAAGRIGHHLTRLLLDAGHQVRAFVLPDDPRAELIRAPGVELFPSRLEDDGALTAAATGVDAIYHLGGALTSRGNSDQEFFDLNVKTTFTLLMAARAAGARLQRFVYASSDAVYLPGAHQGPCYLPIDESHPRLAATVYGGSKVAAEDLSLSFWRAFGVPTTILRFGATADADELVTPNSVFARWLFLHEAIAHLERSGGPTATLDALRTLDDGRDQVVIFANANGQPEIRQWSDARDVADGCARVLDVPGAIGEAFNLGGVAPFAADTLGTHLADRLGMPCVTALLPSARAAWYISSAKARGVLGYQPRWTVFDMVDEAIKTTHHSPAANTG